MATTTLTHEGADTSRDDARTSAPDLTQVLTNPRALASRRDRIGIVTEAARRAGAYIAGAADRAVTPTAGALAALDTLDRPFPAGPTDAAQVLRELDLVGSPATVVSTHGRYFGYVNGGTNPAGLGAAIMASAWDQNTGIPQMSPISAATEAVAGRWIVDALGLPSEAVASFTSGATIANLTAILSARDALLARAGWDVGERGLAGAPALRVVIGAEAHATVRKALRLAGFGTVQIEEVPTDDTGAIDADAFPTDLDDLTLVILQAGNVNTGTSDPFARIIPGARASGAWIHVDGAFGLWAAASPALRDQVAGVDGADSWATDAHKWLNAPYDSGIVIVRDVDALMRAMRLEAAYLATDEYAPAMNRGIQASQRARGVETWAVLASLGRSGLAEAIESNVTHARRIGDGLADAGAELLAPVQLNQVLVAFGDDDTTTAVIAQLQRDGTVWAGGSRWNGRAAMRISVSDHATTRDDADAAVAAVLRAWERVQAGA